jgi:hypothetical protein
MFTANFGNLLQKLRQVGDVGRNPPRLIFGEQIGGRIARPGSSSK